MERNIEIAKIAYEEGIRCLSEQQQTLESIRGRASTNIAIVSLAASFLATDVLKSATQGTLGLNLLILVAILFVASILLSIAVLRSGTGWVFNQSPAQIVSDYNRNNPDLSLTEVYEMLAGYIEESVGSNETNLISRLRILNVAFVLTTAQVFIAVCLIGISL